MTLEDSSQRNLGKAWGGGTGTVPRCQENQRTGLKQALWGPKMKISERCKFKLGNAGGPES